MHCNKQLKFKTMNGIFMNIMGIAVIAAMIYRLFIMLQSINRELRNSAQGHNRQQGSIYC